MDTKIKVASLAIFFVLALLVAAVAFRTLSAPLQVAREGLEPIFHSSTQPGVSPSTFNRLQQQLVRQAELDHAAERIAELQALLAQKDALLERKNKLLEAQSAERAKLQAEANDYFALLTEIGTGQPAAGDAAATADAPGEQLQALRSAVAASEAAQNSLQAELSQIKDELSKANEALLDYELAQYLGDEASVQQVSTNVLLRIGSAAVPALVERLTDERPVVRAWAAAVLGGIGPSAADAEGPLLIASTDQDERVRSAATAALRAILD